MFIYKNTFCAIAMSVFGGCLAVNAATNDGVAPLTASQLNDTTITSLDWQYESIKNDSTSQYYLFNLSERLFLNDDNTLGTTATTLWTISGTDISSQNGLYISVTRQNQGTLLRPDWVVTATSDSPQPATSVLESIDSTYYVIGNTVNTSLFSRQERYITADSAALGVTTGKEITEQAHWIFISTDQYKQKTADIDMDAWLRSQAIEALTFGITDAESFRAALGKAPQASKTALQTSINAAKLLKSSLDRGGIVAKLVSTQSIIDATTALENTIAQMQGITDCYLGAIEEIDNAEQIGSTFALQTIITAARSGIELAINKPGINNALNTMHYALIGYLQQVDSLDSLTNLTGLISNPSFERGNMDGWMSFDVDPQKVDITKLSMDNLAGLAGAISLGMREGTRTVDNTTADSIPDVHGKYYMFSNNEGSMPGQPLLQMLLGLPAGTYQLDARMAVTRGLLNTNGCHLTAITISSDILQQLIGNIDFTRPDISSIIESIDIASVLPTLIQEGNIVTLKANGKDINTLVDASLSFDIQKNDIVLVVLNGGMLPLIANTAYKADNLQLHYLHAPVIEEESASVSAIAAPAAATTTYDLSGRQIKHGVKGIIIRNGKKFMTE